MKIVPLDLQIIKCYYNVEVYMTIFDTLRYPISRSPTSEELTRLPMKLFYSWKIRNGFSGSTAPGDVEYYYKATYRSYISTHSRILQADNEIKALRKLIEEYEDDDI